MPKKLARRSLFMVLVAALVTTQGCAQSKPAEPLHRGTGEWQQHEHHDPVEVEMPWLTPRPEMTA